ncbi:HU family DNA-binding protein [Vibrio campbellii]|uniref:HU family DNA-binding protein n=1 Tax=Vibrio campbellii TaxID=680 RepID=A0AAE9MVC6_9VIBR|nr:HU family DNA-binding protein [Vibrio campbellii]UTZ25380.1 HU family DNA-binding protein [Vibrio campbellii]
MNKAQLIEYIANTSDLSKADAERALNAVMGGIVNVLSFGEEVTLIGFGTFKVNSRAARTGRNPKTGEELQIPAANVPVFKASKVLKVACNQ